MTRLLALLGIDHRIERVRTVAGEGWAAAEDRAQLLGMAWDEEKLRLKRLLLLLLALVGLTLLAATLLSVAVIVHFWDSPQRALAAWIVALVWTGLWAAAVWGLLRTLGDTPETVQIARDELARDQQWLERRFGDPDKPPKVRPATRRELLDRIERQRRRLELEERLEAAAAEAPEPESASAKAVRLARAHPMAAGAAAAVVVALVGPRRLARVAGWALPVLWKFR